VFEPTAIPSPEKGYPADSESPIQWLFWGEKLEAQTFRSDRCRRTAGSTGKERGRSL